MNRSWTLSVKNLYVAVHGRQILNGVSFTVKPGGVHALMGPNASGKSTLAMALMGHPAYTVTKGTATYRGKNILKLTPEARSKLGLFLSFQHPIEVPGVPMRTFLRAAQKALQPQHAHGAGLLDTEAHALGFSEALSKRNLNEGFSGGEKKRSEVLQMAVLQPSMAILDEPDSGLDVDALKTVVSTIHRSNANGMGLLVITHNPRILQYLKPDRVHGMIQGRIVATGDRRLAQRITQRGYASWATAAHVSTAP